MLFRLAIAVFLLTSGGAKAACTFAEQAEKSGKINIAFMQYIYCAEEENDAEAQYKLGSMYYQGVGLPGRISDARSLFFPALPITDMRRRR